MLQPQQRRRKTAILTPQGFQKLQTAQSQTAIWNHYTKSCTLETLSERTGLSTHTLSKVHAQKKGVDLRSLVRYFKGFDLTLEPSDYMSPIQDDETKRVVPSTPPPQWSAGHSIISSKQYCELGDGARYFGVLRSHRRINHFAAMDSRT